MARNTGFTSYDEEGVGTFDDDSDFIGYGSLPPRAVGGYSPPEDPMPLFLSSDSEEPRLRGFGAGGERRGVIWARVIKAGIFAALAAVIALAIVSLDNPLAMFANAKASLTASSGDQSAATQEPVPPSPDPQQVNPAPIPVVQLASAGPTPVIEPAAEVRTAVATPKIAPSRDDIALALRSAHQSQNQSHIQTPAEPDQPPVAAAPTPRRLDADELATLLKRAKGLIAIGDIAPARLLLERAADAQEPSAALLLAQTYDPVVLGAPDLRSVTADPAMAREWYQKAAKLGSSDAKQRLAQMQK
jgi:hypothetical protein